MGISYNPKSALANIAKNVTAAVLVSQGLPPDQAAAAGGVVDGVIRGVEYKKKISAPQELKNTISKTVSAVVDDNTDYIIPEECKEYLIDLFAADNVNVYIATDNNVEKLKHAIKEACSKSDSCDVDSLPLDIIANRLISGIDNGIRENPNLMLLSLYENSKELLAMSQNSVRSRIDIYTEQPCQDEQDELTKKSIRSAEAFNERFQAKLFLDLEQDNALKLSDIYIDSYLSDDDGNKYCGFDELFSSYPQEDVIFIEGVAGTGKSSFLMKVATQYLNKETSIEKRMFFVRGKDISNSDGNPITDITNVLGLKDVSDLDGSIIFLDAYDEIAYAAANSNNKKEYLSRLLNKCESFNLVITLRANYISEYNGLHIKLESFDVDQRIDFLNNYNSKSSEKARLSNKEITALTLDDTEYDDNINELISIPMLLYLIVANHIDISLIEDQYDLYELIFSPDGKGIMVSRGDDKKRISKRNWTKTYNLALEISKCMFFKNDPYITNSDIQKYIERMDIEETTKDILKNRFGVEIYLTGENNMTYTFLHDSIFEYFAAKGVLKDLGTIISQYIHGKIEINKVIEGINNVFPANYYNSKVMYYIFYNANKGNVIEDFTEKENLDNIENLLNQLLASNLCTGEDESIPYIVRLKNMLLWVFNTFASMFSVLNLEEDYHLIRVNYKLIRYLLKLKELDDILFISHLDLPKMSFYKCDLGEVFFIRNNLDGACFKEANCKHIVAIPQSFNNSNFIQADFWDADLDNVSFDKSDLRYADFRNASLKNVSFRGADLRRAYFDDADLSGADFTDAYVYLKDFKKATHDPDAFEHAKVLNAKKDDSENDYLTIEMPDDL